MRSQQEVYETMYYEAGKSLSRVLPSYYEDDRLILLLMMMRGVCVGMAGRPPPFNLDQRHVQVAVAPSNRADLKQFVLSKVFQLIQSQQVPLHHRVGVRERIGKEDLVITVFEFVVETEAVVGLPINTRSKIGDVKTVNREDRSTYCLELR